MSKKMSVVVIRGQYWPLEVPACYSQELVGLLAVLLAVQLPASEPGKAANRSEIQVEIGLLAYLFERVTEKDTHTHTANLLSSGSFSR